MLYRLKCLRDLEFIGNSHRIKMISSGAEALLFHLYQNTFDLVGVILIFLLSWIVLL